MLLAPALPTTTTAAAAAAAAAAALTHLFACVHACMHARIRADVSARAESRGHLILILKISIADRSIYTGNVTQTPPPSRSHHCIVTISLGPYTLGPGHSTQPSCLQEVGIIELPPPTQPTLVVVRATIAGSVPPVYTPRSRLCTP